MILQFLNVVGSNNLLLAAAIVAEVMSMYLMNRYIQEVESHSVGPPPDLWFGFTETKLYIYLESLGEEGRKAYLRVNNADLYYYMWCYMTLLGSLLSRQCQKANISRKIALIFPLVMGMDVIESITFRYSAMQFPLHLSEDVVFVASISNQLKWIGFIAGLFILGALFVCNFLRSKQLKVS